MILAGCPSYVSSFQTDVNFVVAHAARRIDAATTETQKAFCMVLILFSSLSASLLVYPLNKEGCSGSKFDFPLTPFLEQLMMA
jgi:hypothetical protein